LGIVALLGAISIGGWAYSKYPDAMGSNLLAEVSGVFLEIALVVFVVDWVVSRRDKNRWKEAYPQISERIATAYTDIMRLLYVASIRDGGYADDLGRYPEFYDRLCSNLDLLRSTIEGFLLALDSRSHYSVRDLELRMRWLKDRLSRSKSEYQREFVVALELGIEFEQFCERTWEKDYKRIKAAVEAVINQKGPKAFDYSDTLDRTIVRDLRYELQQDVLDTYFKKQGPYGVLYDYKQETSMYYFVIDLLLLRHHARAGEHA